jgi:hypothetical protein
VAAAVGGIETRTHGGSSAEKEEKTTMRKTEDRLDHRHKHGGEYRRARVRVQP